MSAGVHARSGRVIQRCEGRHAPEARAEDLGDFEKKSVELSLAARRRRVTFSCSPRACGRVSTCREGADGKVSIERWYLSPYVEKPLNSKVIKKFRT